MARSPLGRQSTFWPATFRLAKAGLALAILLATLAACAPRAALPRATTVSDELHRTALSAYHRMELAYLQAGAYTTNALIDLDLPRGVKWTLEEFTGDHYRLRFSDDARPGTEWLVSPAGVMPAGSGMGG
jgi:hypothetical protein